MGCGVSKQRRVVVEQSLDAASPSVIVVKAADSPTATPVDAEFPHNHPVCPSTAGCVEAIMGGVRTMRAVSDPVCVFHPRPRLPAAEAVVH